MTPEIRAAALDEARSWIGTPYRHQASVKGSGADCLGLVRGVWRALHGAEPDIVPPYRPDWAERSGAETLLNAARLRLSELDASAAAPGDVLLFRYAAGHPAKHCAILSSDNRMIHAWHGRSVCETGLTPWWRRRLAGVFAFPPSSDRT
jgi:NlpC/P60 family putative phage cell wall peptidase